MYSLKIITSTVRPGRKGPIVARWVAELAKSTGHFDVEVLELGEINLPMMNEPHHPMMRQYQFEHTKQWAAKIAEADAFIFVTAEYDYNYPAPLRNALEYLYHEWNYKAASIVSYGGLSAGLRATNNLKGDLSTFKIVPVAEGVHIPFFAQFITEEEIFQPAENVEKSAAVMFTELVKWTRALETIRKPAPETSVA